MSGMNCCTMRTTSSEERELSPKGKKKSPQSVQKKAQVASHSASPKKKPAEESAKAGNGENTNGGTNAAATCEELGGLTFTSKEPCNEEKETLPKEKERSPKASQGEAQADTRAESSEERTDEKSAQKKNGEAINGATESTEHGENRAALKLTSKEEEQFQKTFNWFDKDGDGLITHEDLRQSMCKFQPTITDKEISDALSLMSSERKECVRFQDFLHAMTAMRNSTDHLKFSFALFDTNCDGTLCRDEVRMLLQHLADEGEKTTEHTVDYAMKLADRDGDGKIDYEEFVHVMGDVKK